MVFIHVPKTAGTSVYFSLREALRADPSVIEGWGKEGAIDLAHPFPELIASRFPEVHNILGSSDRRSFAVVRDPVQRCLSAFAEHRRQYGGHQRACGTLGEYLEQIALQSYLPGNPVSRLFIHGAPQHLFLRRDEGWLVDRVFRFEDGGLLERVGAWLGLALSDRCENRFPRFRRVIPRSDEARWIDEIYRDDYRLISRLRSGADGPCA